MDDREVALRRFFDQYRADSEWPAVDIIFEAGYDAGLAAASAKKWVPVSERNPDSDSWYFALVDNDGLLMPTTRRYAIEVYGTGIWKSEKPVIAWMPIPKYTEGKDSDADELEQLRQEYHLSSLGDRPSSMAANKLRRLLELEGKGE